MYKDYKLDRFQREALQAVRAGDHVLVSAPTGCGKTLIAEYAIEQALERGERIIYTAPIKALSNQKFRDFGAMYGAKVGIMTGDVTINPGAQALIMTTEIFRNTIFDDPSRLADVRYVIHDEVHYLDDPDRGTVWEESIIFSPPEIRFIGLSATISNLDQLAGWIREIRPGRLRVVRENRRPVPLHLQIWNGERAYDIAQLKGNHVPLPRSERKGRGRRGRRGTESDGADETRALRRRRRRRRGEPAVVAQMRSLIDHIVERKHLPAIVFVFSRAYVEKYARRCRRLDLLDEQERARIREHWRSLALEFELDETEPRTAALRDLLLRGIAYHHAGMLPTLKEVVERLFTSGLIKLLFATETFALGVNMPARAVAFETLKKFDGIKRDWMRSR
ncbi:MAG: DEAD/DEAH box helicase, partial [Planctomycetota bacterium]